LFPGANRLRQENREQPVCFGTDTLFHLTSEDDQRLSQERVFCHKFGLASGKVCKRLQQERGGVRFGPGDEALVERLKEKTYQTRDKGENPMQVYVTPL
jgi:hypothetical protein